MYCRISTNNVSLERPLHDLNVGFDLKIGQEMMSLQLFEVIQLFDFDRFLPLSDQQAATATSLTALLWSLETSRNVCSKGRQEDKLSTRERTIFVAAPQA